MGLLQGIFCLIGVLLISCSEVTFAQTKRASRITSSRAFGINSKTNSNGVDFNCPEEFGYYPHPTDCTQYYVCVFGGALLESCTGGLMYSHELQTCDWPRNVGCEVQDARSSPSTSYRDITQGRALQQPQPQSQPQIRFSSTTSKPTIAQQYHRQPSQSIQIQNPVQTLPPPPELSRIAPNPVITSRGQPKPIVDSQEDIAKLYADTHDTLPPIEEEESDRQQRVYRGQPSTLSQVQRDRDGIIHHSNANAIPNHGKVGSYAFGSAINQYRVETSSQGPQIYVQQQQQQPQQQPQQLRPKPLTEQNNNNYNYNRNYYNTTTIQQPYHQQQQVPSSTPISLKSHSSQSHPQIPFYSSYDDDDVDLYRDVEYNQQQLQPQQQQQVRGKSTYRPNEQLVTTPLPISVPQPPRDSFNKPILKPKEPQYSTNNNNNPPPQQAHSPFSYSTDYEDSLIPQLEDENDYNQPTRQPIREEVEIQPLNGKPIIVSSTFGPPTNEIDDDDYYTSTRRPLYAATTPLYTTTMRTTASTSTTTTRRTVPITKPREEFITTTPTIIQRRRPINSTTPSVPTKRINSNRNRGSATHFSSPVDVDKTAVNSNRGTHPPSRSRPTLKPASDIVSKTQQFVDIYRNPPTRPDPLYPQPTPDRTAAKCRKDVCLLPDCYCGGKDIPGDLAKNETPQIVLMTFDDAINDVNSEHYEDLFKRGRKNPNGCPITATFYVSHEWTEYSQVQNLYADGHEMASHTVSHSFGEQFSQKKWTKEVAGQREILSAYGGVKLSDIRGMRAPFLSIGGNKMFKMLYDSNFTYDSSMPVYENRPPSWPYTLDYKIFHDCMIPPCPTKSYPGVWEVPMVMWQDLNGGRCSMGDACSNPGDSDGVFKMIMKNFERHYTTNRAPFGLFYHAAWFTQPHHKAGFIKFLDAINSMNDVWIVTNTQALQWVRDPTPLSRINSFQPFQCDFSDRPKRCNNPKVCNLWHKSGVRYMRTCQPCPDIYPWTGKTGIRSSRVDTEIIEE